MAIAIKAATGRRTTSPSRSSRKKPAVNRSTLTKGATAKVFMSGRSQAVRIPLEFRFQNEEVSIRRDALTGDVILSEVREKPQRKSWKEIFAAMDALTIPDDLWEDRDKELPQERNIF